MENFYLFENTYLNNDDYIYKSNNDFFSFYGGEDEHYEEKK